MIVGYVIEMIKETERIQNRLDNATKNPDEGRKIKIDIDAAEKFDMLLKEEIDRLKSLEVKIESVRDRLDNAVKNHDESLKIKIDIDDAEEFDMLLEEEIDKLKSLEVKNE